MDVQGNTFNDCFGRQYTLREVVDAIISFIEEDRSRHYHVIIGTDSENHDESDFVSAVIVHRVGNGGRYWWRRLRLPRFKALRARIWREVSMSLELAQAFVREVMSRKSFPDFHLEIHVDVGTQGETRAIVQEVIGMVRGSGFEVKTKPDSYAASKVADRHM
jgi:predicted RNase H-related nuclease YkuK (DUF458 family)